MTSASFSVHLSLDSDTFSCICSQKDEHTPIIKESLKYPQIERNNGSSFNLRLRKGSNGLETLHRPELNFESTRKEMAPFDCTSPLHTPTGTFF